MLDHQHFHKEMPHQGRDRQPAPKRSCIPFPDSHGMQNDKSTTTKSGVTLNYEPVAVNTIGVRLSTTETVGKQFDEYIKDIWSRLMDDGVFSIGIHGIGGVGKTEVAKHFHNKLLVFPNKFHHVFWVDMSATAASSGVCDVQSSISKAVGVDLSDGDDESKRAEQLSLGLAEKKKSVLILDDVWDSISLQQVGVPAGVDGCTVLLTTRSLEVCRKFACQRKIEILCLHSDESSELFVKILGKENPISREIEEISNKCAGLPLATTIMARNIKVLADMGQWTSASQGHMWKKASMEIFQKLKTSYDHLKDPTLQRFFLSCSLFVGDNKRRLVEYLVDVAGITTGRMMTTRREELDKARTILHILSDVGLLEITSFKKGLCFVQMNEVIRSMALQIMEESQQPTMVKVHMSLKDLPGKDSWTDDLVGVSLKQNEIESINPSNFSPRCSKLSTLLLSQNRKLSCIGGDSFFEGMPGLKVLDLSFTDIESLPSAACRLVNLTTLLLKWCKKLRKIPSVAALRALKKLDLSFTGIGEVPEDIGTLSELTYLDLFFTPVEDSNSRTLAKLSNLQYLRLPWSAPVNGGEDFAYLSRLETLGCRFCDVFELNKLLLKWVKERKPRAPLELYVQVGGAYNSQHCFTESARIFFDDDDDGVYADKGDDWSLVEFYKCNINEVDLLNYFQEIVIEECNEARSLCNFSRLIEGVSKLKYVSVKECLGIEMLFSLSLQARAILENLEYLILYRLENLSVLLRKEGELVPYGSCFSNLTRFVIQECPRIKRLFPVRILLNLKNLKRFYVKDCALMEEIFESEGEERRVVCCLSGLLVFYLQNLPELRRVCGGGRYMCGIPKSCSLVVRSCPKLTTEGVCRYQQPL